MYVEIELFSQGSGTLIKGTVTVVKVFLFDNQVKGYPSIITAVTFLGGLQLFVLGVFGEYLAKIFMETKGRPNYVVVNESTNISDL